MCKHCVCCPVVQALVGHLLIVLREEDCVGVHLPGRNAPAHREVGGASRDCDISGRSRFCGHMSHHVTTKVQLPRRAVSSLNFSQQQKVPSYSC